MSMGFVKTKIQVDRAASKICIIIKRCPWTILALGNLQGRFP